MNPLEKNVCLLFIVYLWENNYDFQLIKRMYRYSTRDVNARRFN